MYQNRGQSHCDIQLKQKVLCELIIEVEDPHTICIWQLSFSNSEYLKIKNKMSRTRLDAQKREHLNLSIKFRDVPIPKFQPIPIPEH